MVPIKATVATDRIFVLEISKAGCAFPFNLFVKMKFFYKFKSIKSKMVFKNLNIFTRECKLKSFKLLCMAVFLSVKLWRL